MSTSPYPEHSDLAEALNPTLDRYGVPLEYDSELTIDECLDHWDVLDISEDAVDPETDDDDILAILAEQTYAHLIPAASLHGVV